VPFTNQFLPSLLPRRTPLVFRPTTSFVGLIGARTGFRLCTLLYIVRHLLSLNESHKDISSLVISFIFVLSLLLEFVILLCELNRLLKIVLNQLIERVTFMFICYVEYLTLSYVLLGPLYRNIVLSQHLKDYNVGCK